MNTTRLSAIVLAGGQSSRMGQDKALLQVGETLLLQRVCEVAYQCADPVYVVTPWVKRYQDILDDRFQLILEVPLLSGETVPHGPLVGFAQGLTQIKTDWVLLLACDLPWLKAEVLQSWSKRLQTVDPFTVALLPQHPSGWWEPLCGFYHRRCLPPLQEFIEQGGRSFQRWLSQQPVQALSLTEPQMLFNCNTPNDLQRVLSSSKP